MTSPYPFAIWGIDLIGALNSGRGGAKYAVVAIDFFKKWTEVKPLVLITCKKVLDFVIKNIICRFNIPIKIVSNNGTQFDGNLFTEFCERNKIIKRFSSVSRPQPNGQVEAVNKTLKDTIKKKLNDAKGRWNNPSALRQKSEREEVKDRKPNPPPFTFERYCLRTLVIAKDATPKLPALSTDRYTVSSAAPAGPSNAAESSSSARKRQKLVVTDFGMEGSGDHARPPYAQLILGQPRALPRAPSRTPTVGFAFPRRVVPFDPLKCRGRKRQIGL
ncbi:uncharacterized protein LOC133034503 [Cannabis sativa]|uniref:uncharacterized protein LOC133034503 n=1 Tax=Cannabis sativa TaxID=3483 RepID=UPI0029CA9E03|nr:uncharacterized protein LOC133034503 [Cannabis sativa]